jgi:hypothetical protein
MTRFLDPSSSLPSLSLSLYFLTGVTHAHHHSLESSVHHTVTLFHSSPTRKKGHDENTNPIDEIASTLLAQLARDLELDPSFEIITTCIPTSSWS